MQAKTEIIAALRKDGWHYTGACKVLISQDGMRLKIVFDDGRIFEGKPESIAGICDACDEYAEDLIVVMQRGTRDRRHVFVQRVRRYKK